MTAFSFVGGSYTARSVNFDAQECLNLYPEISGSGESKSPAMLVGTPGGANYAVGSNPGPIRALYRFNNELAFAITPDAIWGVSGGFTGPYGSIAAGTTPVSIADNGSVMMVVTGPNGYFFNPTTLVLTPIVDPDFVGGDKVGFLAGRFVWNKPGTGQFQYTEVYGTDIDSLNFQTAEASPDNIVSLIVGFGELWTFGVNSTEVFQPSGDPDIPFAKVQGASMEIGCAAKNSVAKIDSSFLWLGRSDEGSGIVWRAVNYQPQRISTHAIEFAIASYGDVSDAYAFTYQQEGHSFYVLTFPSAERTWCYDVSTNLWHERASYTVDAARRRWRWTCQMNFDNKTLVGDYYSLSLFALDLDAYKDADSAAPIIRRRAARHLSNDLKAQFFRSLQIDFEGGVGIADFFTPARDGEDPQAMLDWSDDGGHTWSNEHWTTIGRAGRYGTRARWRRLGYSRDRVFRVTISDPVKVIIIGATAEVEVGSN